MKCTFCARELPADGLLCPYCGASRAPSGGGAVPAGQAAKLGPWLLFLLLFTGISLIPEIAVCLSVSLSQWMRAGRLPGVIVYLACAAAAGIVLRLLHSRNRLRKCPRFLFLLSYTLVLWLLPYLSQLLINWFIATDTSSNAIALAAWTTVLSIEKVFGAQAVLPLALLPVFALDPGTVRFSRRKAWGICLAVLLIWNLVLVLFGPSVMRLLNVTTESVYAYAYRLARLYFLFFGVRCLYKILFALYLGRRALYPVDAAVLFAMELLLTWICARGLIGDATGVALTCLIADGVGLPLLLLLNKSRTWLMS